MKTTRIMLTPVTATATSAIFVLLSGLCYVVFNSDNLMGRWLPILGLLAVAGVALMAARATMVAWITVLVLLAFAGNRRRVLVKHGRKITADVAMYLASVMVKERGLLAVAFAALFSFVAVARSTEIDLLSSFSA
ncbi:hypothetical protein E5676_scaffold350G001030 [Cucumis melo var. makuwa]|uniref:Uncharacterized protein n=1 Tax=Cucumis melo var. makuwa TaxID=1194695 RepID=A0A5D3BFC5_CUCMM|nr:hypothetical protein E6C27_scaffold274G001000 [Cucumis melo var. makuwa]TYJ98500.1 hypothetical protein E5676_scaffold350G001030 [Cucumis melo var. makuwa]